MIKPIVLTNDIEKPKTVKRRKSLKRTKDQIDYEIGINALNRVSMNFDDIDDKIKKKLTKSEEEFRLRKNRSSSKFIIKTENWSSISDNIADMPQYNKNANDKHINNNNNNQLENTMAPKHHHHYKPVPPSRNGLSSLKRRPLPSRSKTDIRNKKETNQHKRPIPGNHKLDNIISNHHKIHLSSKSLNHTINKNIESNNPPKFRPTPPGYPKDPIYYPN
ncbi:hypothetical protein M9Y10_010195 [Tritrichomonas musculus]|uniref:Uncharacterized protein n=1 Tax=Tritrichomonas musculus TaxID=1915356 RepID=A0ABR2IRX0_9EUKA